MGWYTELKIGGYNWSWRKNLPIEVPLLFFGHHKIIGENIIDLSSDSNDFVGFEATVGQVISNLDKLGLTLDFFISTYSSYREGLIHWGVSTLNARKFFYELEIDKTPETKKGIKELNNQIKRIKESNGKNDILCSIEVLKSKIKLESHLYDDRSLIPSLDTVDMKYLNDLNIIEATSFGIFLNYAHENLPEIAWLYEVRLILETLNKRTKVKLDMKEWVMEGLNMDVIKDSIDSLALKAKTYTKTFDAILGGNETYNKEYERIQLTEKWKKLNSLKKEDISKGTKLEDFIASLFHKKFGFDVLAKKLLTETQELDIILKNVSKNDFVKSLNSPFVLIECKNWSSPVGVAEARVFESKYRESGSKVNLGIFVAINGVTKPFKTHINNLIREGINLIVVNNKDIEQYLYSEDLDIGIWLENLISKQFVLK
ncbi:hypothetical protein EYY60_14645 [Flavobacterium zhairuonense]|uniref:HEPN/Toprim-associated domain-containing protein n=1 Tax=Flavobacterium zhairuonense TaxID=2493631 RepID=UPI00105254DB|nr:HEPN/Toprim-associated domain-containing protein [Flavobacterium zhairuonense]KAF2508366.1 hypothetical protein EYY60_14645 [Flavobacterium zhairuonense]